MIYYILPFLVFIVFTYAATAFSGIHYLFYPVKTIATGYLLWQFRKRYTELKKDKFDYRGWPLAILVGILVFTAWIGFEGYLPTVGYSEFNPFVFSNRISAVALIGFRFLGAVAVVPLMEELFWRSFLIRWIIHPKFESVPIGMFTWSSFLLTTILFGVEHHRWAVGMLAGAAYNGLLYYRKRLWPCIIAHATTNLLLGVYVVTTQQWSFW